MRVGVGARVRARARVRVGVRVRARVRVRFRVRVRVRVRVRPHLVSAKKLFYHWRTIALFLDGDIGLQVLIVQKSQFLQRYSRGTEPIKEGEHNEAVVAILNVSGHRLEEERDDMRVERVPNHLASLRRRRTQSVALRQVQENLALVAFILPHHPHTSLALPSIRDSIPLPNISDVLLAESIREATVDVAVKVHTVRLRVHR